MRRLTWLLSASSLLLVVSVARAQQPEQPAEGGDEEEWTDEEQEQPRLRPPSAESLQLGEEEEAPAEEEEAPAEEEEAPPAEEQEELPSPEEAQQRLERGASDDTTNPTNARWTTPQTVVELHGYMRFRGEFQDNFFFNRQIDPGVATWEDQVGRGAILPFAVCIPAEDATPTSLGGPTVMGGCSGAGTGTSCDQNALAYANMRLRLEPTINLSDDVRVRMQLDVFDNMVLGSTPNSFVVGPASFNNPNYYIDPYYRYERTTFAPIDTATTSLAPPRYGVNSLTDSIIARRAWAEVRNRGLGELRFGRMGRHWGLGILANGGTGIDSDYQTDVDSVMLSTRLAGIYIFGAWDFAGEGLLYQEPADLGGLPFDRSRVDDIEQFAVGAAYRATEEEQTAALARGDAVFNVGLYGVYRNQNLSSSGTTDPFTLCTLCSTDGTLAGTIEPGAQRQIGNGAFFVRRGADVFIADLWAQFLYEKLRLEIEAVGIYGTIDNLFSTQYVGMASGGGATLLQGAVAFEGEYHLLNDQLGIYFNAGYASGDQDQEGLSNIAGFPTQVPAGPNGVTNNTYSTFYMHPNYRIDLIFWRNVMRQIGGAYYFRPGISYDFIRNSFGQLLGARADVVWSRASQPLQAWGNQDDLGVEIDASAYYRSEDGPDLLDGFYAQVQWGIFFPLGGLGYLPLPTGGTPPSLGNAMTFRLILGVMY